MSHSLREVWSPFRSPVRNGECPAWNVTEMPPCAHYTGGAREESTEQIDALIPFLAIKFVHMKTYIQLPDSSGFSLHLSQPLQERAKGLL